MWGYFRHVGGGAAGFGVLWPPGRNSFSLAIFWKEGARGVLGEKGMGGGEVGAGGMLGMGDGCRVRWYVGEESGGGGERGEIYSGRFLL